VLVKGGHLAADPATDVLVTRRATRVYRGEVLPQAHTRGTGCLLASAIATRLALGEPLESAIARAKAFVAESIRHGMPLGPGRGPADPMHVLAAIRPSRAPVPLAGS
jgi:hydroxymethylpyrimidine/phosphomethylpyrimidine kinase